MRLISSVRSGAPGNPNRKKKQQQLRFYSFIDRFKVLFFLSIQPIMCCRRWVQKSSSYIYLQANIIRKKQNKTKLNSSSATLCDPWVFSSWLELAVVCGVIFRSGLHYIFVSVWKSKKKWFWSKTLPLSILNHFRVVYINRMDQQICFVRFARG